MATQCPSCGRTLRVGIHAVCFSDDGGFPDGRGQYRYRLETTIPGGDSTTCLFLMLNPSDANERKPDATVDRCKNLTMGWGVGRLLICNLFALRSPNPRALRSSGDPVGPDNDAHIREAARQADIIVCAWGGWRGARGRARQVVRTLINEGRSEKLHTLGFTKSGEPKHPKPQNPNQWPKANDLSQWQPDHLDRWLGAMRQNLTRCRRKGGAAPA